MRSEAVSSLRNWAKDRLGEQEDLLRLEERAIMRLAELDDEPRIRGSSTDANTDAAVAALLLRHSWAAS